MSAENVLVAKKTTAEDAHEWLIEMLTVIAQGKQIGQHLKWPTGYNVDVSMPYIVDGYAYSIKVMESSELNARLGIFNKSAEGKTDGKRSSCGRKFGAENVFAML